MALGAKTGGRKKGTPNKVTGDVREMILAALDDAGGRKYLAAQAAENPSAFMALVGRCLPKDIQVKGELTLRQLIEGVSETSRPHAG